MDSIKGERRVSKRIIGKSLVQFQGKNFKIYSNLSDIGEGGVFVNTYYMLDEGEPVDLKFNLPRMGRYFDVKGKVIRQRELEAGLGIVFENLSDEDRLAIRNFIATGEIA